MSQALVQTSETTAVSGAPSASQYLTFMVGSELFALPIALVREVIEFQGLTRIPLAPPAVPGVLNLRGAVVPVVDLAARFGRPAAAIGRRTCVVVVEMRVEDALQPVGVIVDSVSEALEVEASQLERRPAFGAGLRPDFVAGMLNLEGRFVVVLDVAQVLSMSELEQLVSDAPLAEEPGREVRSRALSA
jgi:purine-binding chemotaxis protein CheW